MQYNNKPYNPFFLIDYHNNETFHSKLLKLFLDVNNSSKAKDFEKEYLKVFIRLINKIKPEDTNEIAEYNEEKDGFFFIHNEYSIDSVKNRKNYFDVFISYGTTAIVIENKLDSSEGDHQVTRYLNWLNKSSNLPGIDTKNRHLVYLTKDKNSKAPKEISLPALNKMNIPEGELESLKEIKKSALITLNWAELAKTFVEVDISFFKGDIQKQYFFSSIIEHLKLNFLSSKPNMDDDQNKSSTESFFKELKNRLTHDKKTKVYEDNPDLNDSQNTGKFDLVLINEDWKIDDIQLYIIIYRHNSLGVFCGISSQDKDLAINKIISKNDFELTKSKKYIRYIPHKKIAKSSEILITRQNNFGDYEAHTINLNENKEKYIREVQKRVNRITMLIKNEKRIRNVKTTYNKT